MVAGVLATAGGTGAAAVVDAVAGPTGVLTSSAQPDGVTDDDVAVDGTDGAAGERAASQAAGSDGAASSSAAREAPGPEVPAAGASDVTPQAEPAPPATPPPPDGLTADDVAAGLLSRAVPSSAGGDLAVVPGSDPAPLPDRTVRTVRVEVEAGLEVDGPLFARMVMDTLNDPRSWTGEGRLTFARTDGDADLRVVLASPQKTDEMCAPLETDGIYSCGAYGHAALNHMRWVQGTPEFADLTQYRQYLVNHEVGHLLGRRHEECAGAGQVAPVMQQQTIRVAPCLPNAWPYPDAS